MSAPAEHPDAGALLERGRALEHAGDHAGALALFERAAEMDPGSAPAHASIARVRERTNDLPGARDAAELALATDPDAHGARLTLASVERREGHHSAARDHLERLLRPDDTGIAPALPVPARATAWNRYGLVLDALDDAEGAMGAFERAHALRWSLPDARRVDARSPYRRLDETRAMLTPERLEAWHAEPATDERADPVFFAGFPRSGTTLTERLLGAHPLVATLDEDSPVREVIARAREFTGGARYPEVLDTIDAGRAAELRGAYHAGIERRVGVRPPGGLVVDKVPLHLLDMGMICRLFPRARVIVAIRDPRDICVSCAMQLMVPNPAMANLRSIPATARFYDAVMGFWLHARERIPNPWIESRYEDLVADPEPTARGLLDFLGLGWDPSVLDFHERARGTFIATPSFETVARPISGSARGRWPRYARWFEGVGHHLDPYLEAFGYGA